MPGAVRTVPATVSPEQVAALELRLAEAEKRLETLFKAHEVDRKQWTEKVVNLFSDVVGQTALLISTGNEVSRLGTVVEQLQHGIRSKPSPPPAPPSRRPTRSRKAGATKAVKPGASSKPRRRAGSRRMRRAKTRS